MTGGIIYHKALCFSTFFFAGGVGLLVEDLGNFVLTIATKTVVTTIALLIASRFVTRYKDWNEANPKNVGELKRFILFIKAGFKKNIKNYCEEDETD